MTNKISKRVFWIDVMKGIGILTVITTHTGFLPFSGLTSPLIGGWMLLIFPYVGGWLFARRTVFTFLKSKKKLLIIYFVAATISFLAWLLLRNNYPQNLLQSSYKFEIWRFLLGKSLIFNGPLWFVPAYLVSSFTVNLIYPQWHNGNDRVKTIILVLFSFCAFVLISLKEIFPFSLDIAFLFVVFFLIGLRVREAPLNPKTKHIIILTTVFIVSSFINGTVDLYERTLGSYPLFLVNSFCGIFLIQILAIRLKNNNAVARFFAYCGRRSLLLLVVHWPVIQWISYILTLTGLPKKIGANPTITSFWLPHTGESVNRVYVFSFLFLYLAVVFIFSFCLRLTYCKLFAIIKPWISKTSLKKKATASLDQGKK